MATTGAVLYIRPYALAAASAGRSTGAVLYVPIRTTSGIYQVGVSETVRGKQLQWLPSAQTPLGYVIVNGKRLPVMMDERTWYRAMDHLFEIKLGGRFAPSLPDVTATVETTQAAAVQSGQQVVALTQQTQANAEVLSVAREVIVNNALVGAAQIPRVVLSPYENLP